jgi:protein associated with RNAse G/E
MENTLTWPGTKIKVHRIWTETFVIYVSKHDIINEIINDIINETQGNSNSNSNSNLNQYL